MQVSDLVVRFDVSRCNGPAVVIAEPAEIESAAIATKLEDGGIQH
jgi:hypothetical protein